MVFEVKKVNIYTQQVNKKNIIKPLKVSVIIPNYNYQDFIEERIDSIILQTYPIYELIILDDCSSDNSVEIIENKIKNIKNIPVKFIKNEKNSGSVFSQWQLGLKNVTGEYFWIAEADDSCDRTFLENLIEPFEKDDNVVLSYAESKKIDRYNRVIGEDCRDWADIFQTNRWINSYIKTGKDEIINSLSFNNSILNVSSLIWKYSEKYYDIFEQAKKFKIAGDWYIYIQVLKGGNIAYNSKSLNYFRKHGNSVSTTMNRNVEYSEVIEIQNKVAEEYKLPSDVKKKQIMRRKLMGFCENEKNINKKGNIAWIIPGLLKGSGGHRTIIQNVNALIEDGYKCDIYVEDYDNLYPIELLKKIQDYYGECKADVYSGWNLVKKYDACVATAFNTVDVVMKADCDKKLYFVQDYEPYFFSMGDYYIQAENSYKNDISVISIGKWLSSKMINEFNLNATYFNFCADLDVYKKIKNIEKEDAICYIFQPKKPRRCDKLALRALQIIQKMRPNIKIYVFGSEKCEIKNLKVEHLGILPIEECNKLYNKCKVGLCMSASNPSRIPFEMMSAGLPVVELYRENNLYDFPNDGCILADSKAEAIATAMLKILDDDKLQKKLSKNGSDYMKNYPLQKGFRQFVDSFNAVMKNKVKKKDMIERSYTKEEIFANNETIQVGRSIHEVVEYRVSNNIEKVSILRKSYKKIIRFLRKIKKNF